MQQQHQAQETIRGIIDRITFFSPETGHAVVKVSPFGTNHYFSQPDNKVTVTLHQCKVYAGASMEFLGEWVIHPKFGRQFKAYATKELKPATTAALEKYLGSGLIFGVGPKIAKKIVKSFGAETLEVFESKIERLMEVEGIAKKKLESIKNSWSEHRSIRDIMLFLQDYGISTLFATKIYRQYGEKTIDLLKDDPYALARDIYGIGFFSADKIALSLGMGKTDGKRIQAGIKHVLASSKEEGHCFLYLHQLQASLKALLQEDIDSILEQHLSSMVKEQEIISRLEQDKIQYYSRNLYFDESLVAKKVKVLLQGQKEVDQTRISQWLTRYNQTLEHPLAPEQMNAVENIAACPFSILTGGPGCGKTTTTKSLVRLLLAMGKKVVLAAPTGRAAQRMGEVVGMEAKTIHRLLEFDPQNTGFKKNEEEPLEGDFFIIDETSMLDISLTASLLKAIASDRQLLFIGDTDQLPSVGAGNVLRDLINSQVVPVFRLTKIFRQAQESSIIAHAHEINKGEIPNIPSPFAKPSLWEEKKDCLFIDSSMLTTEQAKFVKKVRNHFDEQNLNIKEEVVEDDDSFNIPDKFLHVDLQQLLTSGSAVEELKTLLKKVPVHSSLNYGMNALEVLTHLYQKTIPKYFGAKCEIQVLTPMARGPLGTLNLNQHLQTKINPSAPHKKEINVAGRIFRLGDRVIQKKNNYDLEVFNGDIGKVIDMNLENLQLIVEFSSGKSSREVCYERSQLIELDLAYAITIHKSQGSEFEAVILPITTAHFKLLMRNLIYTGLTRGKKLVLFVGEKKALAMAINNQEQKLRQTFLKELLI